MSKILEPHNTVNGTKCDGRPLDRADEEVVDQGVWFDRGPLVSRRGVIGLLGIGVGSLALAACSTPAPTAASTSASAADTASPTDTAMIPAPTVATGDLVKVPDETAGPYPGDGSNGPNALTKSGIVRSDIRASIGGGTTATGVPMTLTLRLVDMANGNILFANAAVYVWHCDAAGAYSMYSSGVENESYLRGVQVADKGGQVTYTSIFPACSAGRWPHIHFEVYRAVADITDSTKAISTSQVALPQEVSETVYTLPEYQGSTANLAQVSLSSDKVFGDDGGAHQLATVTGDIMTGYNVELTVGVDAATVPTAGSVPGGAGSGGTGGPVAPPAAPGS